MAALAAQKPFDVQALGLGVHLGVELLGHVEGGEGTEVAALRGVGGQGVVQVQLVEEQEITHEGIDAGIREHVARGGDEEDFGVLFVKGRLGADAGDGFAVVGQHFHDFHKGMGLDAQVVAGEAAVFDRVHDPVDAQAHLMQQFAHDHGDFRRVDAVGAVQRAAAAFRTLVGVVEELLDHAHVPAARAHLLAQNLAEHGVVAPVEGTQQLGAQHGHVFGVVGAQEEVALVRAGAAAHADVHEQLQRAVLLQPVGKGVTENFFPILRQVPVLGGGVPLVRIGHVQEFHGLFFGRIAEAARHEFRLGVEPAFVRKGRAAGDEHLRRR